MEQRAKSKAGRDFRFALCALLLALCASLFALCPLLLALSSLLLPSAVRRLRPATTRWHWQFVGRSIALTIAGRFFFPAPRGLLGGLPLWLYFARHAGRG